MTVYHAIRRLAGKIARTPTVRWMNSVIAAAGFDGLSRRCSRYTRYAPDIVEILLPDDTGGVAAAFRMYSDGGNDNVAFEAWRLGFVNYEPPFPRLYLALIRNARVIIGVGANSGLYELAAAAYRPDMQIYAFEPFPDALSALRKNIALNHMQSAIQVIDHAAADVSGIVDFYVPAKTHGSILETSASLNPDFRPGHSAVLRVPAITLDAFSEAYRLNRIDLLRMDVESAEHRVLQGAGRILLEHRPFVMLEVLESADTASLEHIRAQYRYVVFAPDCEILREKPRLQYESGSENQVLCPEERVDEFVKCLRDARLQVFLGG